MGTRPGRNHDDHYIDGMQPPGSSMVDDIDKSIGHQIKFSSKMAALDVMFKNFMNSNVSYPRNTKHIHLGPNFNQTA